MEKHAQAFKPIGHSKPIISFSHALSSLSTLRSGFLFIFLPLSWRIVKVASGDRGKRTGFARVASRFRLSGGKSMIPLEFFSYDAVMSRILSARIQFRVRKKREKKKKTIFLRASRETRRIPILE